MGSSRQKLQGDIDRVLKKVQEGVDAFDSTWNKVYDTESWQQKVKFEADLKKEIKKLQRYRDQIKTWIQSSEIKEKKVSASYEQALRDACKQIEREMERFKVCEKESKLKAFSKEGLDQQPRTDYREKAKAETRDWLNSVVSDLENQIDNFEAELEGFSEQRKQKHPRLVHLKKSITRHKTHIKILESILRLLDNDELRHDQVDDVKDFIEDYVERNQEDFDEFSDVEDLYCTIPIQKFEALKDLISVASSSLIKEDFGEFSDVEDRYSTIHTQKVVALEDLIIVASSRLIKENDGATCANSNPESDIKEQDKACITKIGPWGGRNGNLKDIEVAPLCLNSITIRSGEVVFSLAFSYSHEYGKEHHAGPWGACEGFSYGSFDTIQLGPSEFLTEVSGTVGFSTQYSTIVVTSVMFITNARCYGPFGGGGGIPFNSPVLSNGSIVGFFARAESVIDAIGLYVNPERQPMKEQDSITKIGPWGGHSGRPNDVDVLPRRLISVIVHSGKVINSLTFTYSDCDGQQHTAGPWGGTGESRDGSFHTILLDRSDFLMEVSGTIGRSPNYSDVLTSLLFVTNSGSYGPFGKGGGTRFRSPLQSNGSIVGFFANAGDVIDAIGVYYNPKRETIKEEVEGGTGNADDMANTTVDASIDRVGLKSVTHTVLDDILDGSTTPTNIPLGLLQDITENFSDKRKIGSGGFGVVYKGVLQNRSIAIKKLLNSHTIEDGPFYSEANFLMNVKHKNIVRFLGFCAHTEHTSFKMEGSGRYEKYIYPEMRERLLCFEYISEGSLDSHLTDELRGLEWHTRYQIIKGICDGMQYLHKEMGIVHMDLKPANILLDDLMVPKITDFGISRHLDGISRAVTKQCLLSLGYSAPEYLRRGEISFKSDIYSLGVIIIDLVTGRKEDPDIKNVLRRWRYRWNKSVNYPRLGYQEVTACIEIAITCMSEDPKSRPYVWDVVRMLDPMESRNEHINNADESTVGQMSPYPWELLEFDALELCFPFELNKQIPCSLELTNGTDGNIAFDFQTTTMLQYCIEPGRGVVPPRSKCSVTVTLQAQKRAPHATLCKDEFVVRCAAVDDGLTAENITEDMFNEKAGKVVDEVKLTVAFVILQETQGV